MGLCHKFRASPQFVGDAAVFDLHSVYREWNYTVSDSTITGYWQLVFMFPPYRSFLYRWEALATDLVINIITLIGCLSPIFGLALHGICIFVR